MPSDLTLDQVSLLLVWTAIAVYALAFIAYAWDLARRSAQATEMKDASAGALVRERQLVAAGTIGAGELGDGPAAASRPEETRPSRALFARIATTLTWLGFLLHVGGDVTRGIAAGRVPWSNMYEFSLTGTMLIVGVYLLVLLRYDLRFLGAFITGLVVLLLGGATLGFYVDITPLADPLKSVWLVVHVFVASLGTAFFALSFGLSVLQLLQSRHERKQLAGMAGAELAGDAVPAAGMTSAGMAAPGLAGAPAVGGGAADASAGGRVAASVAPRATGLRFLTTLPGADALESLAYRFAIIGFIFWTFTLIAGSIWANDAWGRYWGFDTKEVWTFVIWVLYAGYIHARATRGWRGTRSAWLAIIGFSAVMFNFTIVNLFFKGLHVYSGLH